MRKFMNHVAVKYCGIVVWVVDYDYGTKLYTIEDRQGCKTNVNEDDLKFLTD